MIENEKAIEHLTVLCEYFSLARHNEMLDALSWLINDRVRLGNEVDRLRAEKATLEGRLAGPRCSLCESLCVDLAKDERGWCPKCVELFPDEAST